MKTNEKLVINKITKSLVKEFKPLKIILFGSRAAGKAKTDSDYDILVIVSKNRESKQARASKAYSSLSSVSEPVDVVVYTSKEVDEWRLVPQAFITTAVNTGRTIYEK